MELHRHRRQGCRLLCVSCFAETSDHDAYIIDVMYTKEPMETTEIAHANMIIRNRVNKVRIEGNNGGRGFRRNSERITKERGYRGAVFEDFHQSDNKLSRILANSAWVENHVYYPDDWATRWPDFMRLWLVINVKVRTLMMMLGCSYRNCRNDYRSR